MTQGVNRVRDLVLELWTRTRIDWGFASDRIADVFRPVPAEQVRLIADEEHPFAAFRGLGGGGVLERHAEAAVGEELVDGSGRDMPEQAIGVANERAALDYFWLTSDYEGLPLAPLGEGRWSGTWQPRRSATAGVTVTARL